MSRFIFLTLSLVLALAASPVRAQHHGGFRPPAISVDWEQFEKDLAGKGVVGSMHGVVSDLGEYVFTYRPDPRYVLRAFEFSLIVTDPEVVKELSTLVRHDQVRIKGKLAKNPSPQRHIELTAIELVKHFDAGIKVAKLPRAVNLPEDLAALSEMTGVVHAVGADGKILVMDYKGAIVPVYVTDSASTKELYRGDKVGLQFTVQKNPGRPTHIRLNTKAKEPVRLIDKVSALHEQEVTLEGSLVFYPMSPPLTLAIFALQEEDKAGLKRDFSLFSGDPAVLKALYQQLAETWEKEKTTISDARNRFINRKIHVKAKGIVDVSSRNQTPTLYVENVADVQVQIEK